MNQVKEVNNLESKTPRKVYHWYILSTRGGKEEKIIENIKLDLVKNGLNDYVRDLKVFSDKNKKKILKGYIFCYCSLTPALIRFFHRFPGIIGFLNHERKGSKLPDFVSPEMLKNFSVEVQEKKKMGEVNSDSTADLSIGDLVKIVSGTFIDYEGRITYLDQKKKKVKIDIDFAGRTTSLDMPIDNCQKVLV